MIVVPVWKSRQIAYCDSPGTCEMDLEENGRAERLNGIRCDTHDESRRDWTCFVFGLSISRDISVVRKTRAHVKVREADHVSHYRSLHLQ